MRPGTGLDSYRPAYVSTPAAPLTRDASRLGAAASRPLSAGERRERRLATSPLAGGERACPGLRSRVGSERSELPGEGALMGQNLRSSVSFLLSTSGRPRITSRGKRRLALRTPQSGFGAACPHPDPPTCVGPGFVRLADQEESGGRKNSEHGLAYGDHGPVNWLGARRLPEVPGRGPQDRASP
jgi:hypothetical protein